MKLTICLCLVVVATAAQAGHAPAPQTEPQVREKLAAGPFFLDKDHPGPSVTGMLEERAPLQASFNCRARQAYLRRVRPGEYHFERAQRLLGEGPDHIFCEAFGLDWFGPHGGGAALRVIQAVQEAEAARQVPLGLDLWVPDALRSTLMSAYSAAADAYDEEGEKQHSAVLLDKARQFRARLEQIRASARASAPDAEPARTPLMAAALAGNLPLVRQLVDSGAEVNAADPLHTTALHLAAIVGHQDVVRFLLAHGAAADVPDDEGVTPLLDACTEGFPDIAAALIAAGAAVDHQAADGTSALQAATSIFGVLRGSRLNQRRLAALLVVKGAHAALADREGRTPLLPAVEQGALDLVEFLVAAGAEVNHADAQGDTPLIAAIGADDPEVVHLLLAKGAKTAVFGREGRSPLMLAVRHGWPAGEQITAQLLAAGADPNLANPDGWTALLAAEDFNYRDPWAVSPHAIVRQLLAHGAQADVRSQDGTTPLMVAARSYDKDHTSFAAELLDAGAAVNAADANGRTALMAAATTGYLSMVNLLLAHGADPHLRDKLGRSAADYALPTPMNDDRSYDSTCRAYDGGDCAKTRQLLLAALAAPPALAGPQAAQPANR